ncbi:CutA1 divalent ion tolerance protein [Ectothiorhodospira sp. PHS-1]|uniref:divalent-cation tolerance protein CutA n=1 Tax=Ectothiorhodospira sp. PHS-1 TaxID=519989 RepID=UPI00024A84D4|nr:divalent-cation tolerance protein CutA [Ectothiorhodospira sp. PHS-1]EHQ52234.1 CutA1 divalent ion tolerance protein [Ectothiorhodospira sp. PHS-1]
MSDKLLILTTLNDPVLAREIAGELVKRRLAACVSILPAATSVYVWEDEVQEDAEHVLLIKSRADCLDTLQRTLQALHPYELPEIIAVPITHGLEGYLRWIDDNTDS